MATKTPTIVNPLTNQPLRPEVAKLVTQARAVRRQARRDARSGNPAKAMPAIRAMVAAPRYIAALYRQEVGR